MNLLDLPEQSITLSSSPAWKAFWTADKYLTCRAFHGKYSLQSNYFRFPNVDFRFLQLKRQTVSAGLFRKWRKRRYPWGELHLCLRFSCWTPVWNRLQDHKCLQSHLRLEHEFSTDPLQSLRLQLHQGVTWALAGIQLGSTAQHTHQL